MEPAGILPLHPYRETTMQQYLALIEAGGDVLNFLAAIFTLLAAVMNRGTTEPGRDKDI